MVDDLAVRFWRQNRLVLGTLMRAEFRDSGLSMFDDQQGKLVIPTTDRAAVITILLEAGFGRKEELTNLVCKGDFDLPYPWDI